MTGLWPAAGRREVRHALLGSWPGTITSWGREAFDAYLGELEDRGLSAESVLRAIRTWPATGSDFPPSAANLAAQARRDPSRPSGEEMVRLLVSPGGVLAVAAERAVLRRERAAACGECEDGLVATRVGGVWEARRCGCSRPPRLSLDEAMRERARGLHPLLAAFIERQGGPGRLRELGLADPENPFRQARVHELRKAWAEFCEDVDERGTAALVAGERLGQLGHFDPLAALGAPGRRELSETTTTPERG